ncbi:MAG: T9SS type A sorting domain-containing protein [Bacteroidota bacterium]
MKKITLLLFLAIGILQSAYSQVSGTYTIPGAPYATIASAISALNAQGVGSGGVVFNVTAGYTETFATPAAGTITTNTGTAANQIIFQKSGAGADPKITAATGAGTMDAIITFSGVQYITFNGIDLYENAGNLTTTTQMEWGYAILKASATQGSQNITIKNCTISLNNTNTATWGIYSNNHTAASTTQLTVTAVTGQNSSNKFYGNTITNCYNGIYLYGFGDATAPYTYYDQNNDIGSVTGNTINNFGGGASTEYLVYVYYQNGVTIANSNISGTSATGNSSIYGIYGGTAYNANASIYGNTVSIVQSAATTGYIYGIYNSGLGTTGSSNTLNIYNNTIQNCQEPNSTTSYLYAIYNAASAFTINLYGNTVNNNVFGGSYYMYLCYSTSATGGTINAYNNIISNNQRTGLGTQSGSSYFYCLYIGGGAVMSIHDNQVFGNNAIGLTTYGCYIYSLYVPGSSTNMSIYNNTVHDQTITSAYTSSHAIYGIYAYTGSGSGNIYNNTVYNLLDNNSSTGYGYGYGFYVYASPLNIYKNKLYNVLSPGTSGYYYGMYFSSGSQINMYNNYISDIRTPASTSTSALYGVYISSPTAANLYYNTIYLNCANSSTTTFSSSGIYASTTPNVELRNNIVINISAAAGSTTYSTAAYRRSSTTISSYLTTSNNNNFYAGTPSATNLIYSDGTNNIQTLAAYKALVSPRDASSITENSPFVNVATTPYDLHMKTTIATQCESGGSVVSTPVAITTDFDGDARYPNAGYPVGSSTPSAPDIGADEFGGILLDLTPPNIAYTPFLNTSSLTPRTLTATITDASGVGTGTGLPRLYWKKFYNGSWTSVQGTSIGSNQYTFTFGSGVVLNDSIYYYVVAQDVATTPNIGAMPSGGASGFTINPPACSTPPTVPYAYKIVGQLCGTFNVGVGQTYTTLTAAIADLNAKEVTCPIVFKLTDATYSASETFPIVLANVPGMSSVNTVTIKPATGVTATISGSSASTILKFNQASNFIIDGSNSGGTDRSLTILNTVASGTTAVIWVGSNGTGMGSTNDVIKNCIISNGFITSTSYGIFAGSAGTLGSAGDDNDNLTIQNNQVSKSYYGIYAIASTMGMNDNLVISGNTIGSTVATDYVQYYGIYLSGANAPLVNGNEVFNLIGTPTYEYGIELNSNLVNPVISNNKIHDLANNNTGGWGAYGINIGTSSGVVNATLFNNLIYNITTINYSTASTTYNPFGIRVVGGTGHKLYHNTVNMAGTQFNSGTTGTLSAALLITTSAVTGMDIRDNIFANGLVGMAGSTSYCVYAVSGVTFGTINYNDYWPYGTYGAFGYLGVAVTNLAGWQAATTQDANSRSLDPVFISATNLIPTTTLMNNAGTYITTVPNDYAGTIRSNPPDIGAYEYALDPLAITVAAAPVAATTATLNGNFNANATTLNTWFDYGLTTAYGTSAAGTPASVTGSTLTPGTLAVTGLTASTTYHFRARGVTSGGMIVYGNDMTFTTASPPPTVVTTAATLITGTTATLNGTVNANNASTTVSFDYGLTVAYGTNVPGVPVTVTGNTVTASLANITGLTPNTLYHFRINGTNVGGTSNGGDLTFTTAAIAPTATTTAANAITTNGATVNGIINANNSSTTVWFDYGLTVAYGTTVAGVPTPVTGIANTNVSAVLTGLITATTYHYRVRGVNSAGTTNGNDMTFLTGCPSVAAAGPITGPASVCANATGNVYTVGAITNATSYAWTVPAGATITAGSGTNTITVTFGATSGNISVAGVGICMTGTASNYAVTVNALPVPTITGPAGPCVNSVNNVYTTETGMTGYTWTVSAGGTITAGATTNAITVTWGTTGAKTVTISYTNAFGCTAATPSSYAVTVNALPTPTITGTATACQGATGVVYTTQAGMTNYVWTVSAGGTVTAGGTATSNTVTVTWSGSGAQTVKVNYANANGCVAATATTYNVTVNPTPVPTIGSNNAPCVGSTGNMYYTEGGMTGYIWTVSAGGTIVSGQGTSAINVTWTGVGAQWVGVNYINATGCSGIAPTVYNLFVNPLPNAAGAITGTATLCAGTNGVAYSCGEILNATSYTWTLPAGATIATGAGTKSITVNFSTSAVSGNITVAGTNSCGNGTVSPAYAVTVNPLPAAAGTITGPASVCVGSTGVAYSVPSIANATSYVWTVPAGATITSGGTTRNIVVSYGPTAGTGTVTVKGTNTCGNGAVSTLNVTMNAIPAAPVVTVSGAVLTSSAASGNQWYYAGNAIAGATGQTYTVTHNTGYYWCVVTTNGCSSPISNKVWVVVTGQQELQNSNFSVYPVPNDGRFTVSVTSPVTETYSIVVYNQLGVKIYELGNVEVDNSFSRQIDLRPVADGIYSVVFFNNSHQVVKKVLINK